MISKLHPKINSKTIGIIITFTALTTALNFVKIPVPFLPTFTYMMGDIAIVVAFLLFDAKTGISVAFLSTIITMIILPGPGGKSALHTILLEFLPCSWGYTLS